jgi:hypothetical protein
MEDMGKVAVACYFAGQGKPAEWIAEEFKRLGWIVPPGRKGLEGIVATVQQPELIIRRREALVQSRKRDAELRKQAREREEKERAEAEAKRAKERPMSNAERNYLRHRNAL